MPLYILAITVNGLRRVRFNKEKEMKLTDWFPHTVRPVHVGVYELEDLPYPFHFWTGEYWSGAGKNYYDVDAQDSESSMTNNTDVKEGAYPYGLRWRGVVRNA